MIAGLRGKLQAIGNNWAIVDVGGVSFQVHMPASTLSTLGAVGEGVELHTHLNLREDGATLYGFATPGELALFQTLTTVSGVGPKLALAMLSAMSVEKLTMAIASGSAELLAEVPGVGKKMASRLVLELKGKLAAGGLAPAELAEENTDVLAALTSLGYSVREATRAIAALPQDQKLSLEEKVKLALQYFGGK
jgi:Holliday junction DNA helicase RuvA